MAKIRTLKAEFFRDEEIARDLVTKTLAAGLICCMADDEGRFKASPARIRGEVFTHDHVDEDAIQEALNYLGSVGFVHLYEVAGRRYGAILNWKRHQPVPPSRFTASILPPAPPQAHRKHTASKAQADRRQVPASEEADASSRTDARGRKGIGRGIGTEGEGEGREPGLTPGPPPSDVQAVFDAWATSLPPGTKREFTEVRRSAIRAALRRASVEDCIAAVQGWRWDDWERRPQVNDLVDCLRPRNLERFRDWERGLGRPRKGGLGAAGEELTPNSRLARQIEAAQRQRAAGGAG